MTAALRVEYRTLSQPAEVWWAGFRSDTHRLQQAGWQLSAEESIHDCRIRLLMQHRDMRLMALTRHSDFDYYRFRSDAACPPPVFEVVMAAPQFQVMRIQEASPVSWDKSFQAVDAAPQFVDNWTCASWDDCKLFAPPLARTEEIVVEPQTVAAMLERIKEMQAPEQARIRAKQRMAYAREGLSADAIPRQAFHAQIISLAEAA